MHQFQRELEIIKELPKTDIHCHIDGSIRPATILELLQRDGKNVPTKNLKEFEHYVQVQDKCNSLKDYLEKFKYPLEVFNTPSNMQRITLEVLEDASKEGVAYTELRYAPFATPDIKDPEENLKAILETLKQGKQLYNIDSNLILCGMRHDAPNRTSELVKLASKYKDAGVVAVDLAGNESEFPPELHKEAFIEAKKSGLKITIHAGECGDPLNIKKSIELCGADRIGHGFSAITDESIINYLKFKKIPLELCIKSNLDTGGVKSLAEHPFRRLFERGILTTINTDNISVSKVTIMDEYVRLLKLGLKMPDIIKVVSNGIDATFAEHKTKLRLKNELSLKVKYFSQKYPEIMQVKTQKNLEL